MKSRKKQWMLLFVAAISALLVLGGCGQKNQNDADVAGQPGQEQSQGQDQKQDQGQTMSWDHPPEMKIDPKKQYTALVQTSKGDFTIELFADEAPITVNNFVFLAREGYYDGIVFHRIMETFMIQGGDPLGNGTGGPGYTIQDELETTRKYEPGIVAMAKTTKPNSAGSQFFIGTGADIDVLNSIPDYPIFGKVTEGMDVVKDIAATPTDWDPSGREQSVPKEKVTIKTIEITEK